MSYSEVEFKRWMITEGALHYKLNELTINPWERKAHPQGVSVTSINTHTAWNVYRKCYEEYGDMIMGRLSETANYYKKYGLEKNKKFNTDKDARINVQNLKNWTVCINDCWMLGAIHKAKTFHLVSSIVSNESIYNSGDGYFIVTGREIMGLRMFGYEPRKQAGKISFHCKDIQKAKTATLHEYATKLNDANNSTVQKAKTALFAQGVY